MQPVTIGIIGVGGFARSHLASIAYCEEKGLVRLAAAVIRNPEKEAYHETETTLVQQGVYIRRTYEEMLENEKERVELVVIPGGIDQHAELSTRALRAGYHVMCEKPVAGTLDEALHMRTVARETGRILAIGYQNIFSRSIARIKEIALSKTLGALTFAKTSVIWPRSSAYYERNPWAGKITFAGKHVYDSIMQNACAHFLQNMLYVAGASPQESATPTSVLGENYRAKRIESADTQCARITTREGATIFFIASHAAEGDAVNPVTEYTFEKGKIVWEFDEGKTTVYAKEGDTYVKKDAFDNETGGVEEYIHKEVFAATARAIREGDVPASTIENALQHTACVEAAFASSKGVTEVPCEYTSEHKASVNLYDPTASTEGDVNVVINGIHETIRRLYDEGKTFYEGGLPWAKESTPVAVTIPE